MRAAEPRRILVIKLGALGDFVQAMGPAAAIRAHHPRAEITLLTTAPFAALGRAAPYFDHVWIDDRPSLAHWGALWRLRRRLREGRFDRVYDLQTSDRSSLYFELMRPGPRPEWSGIARGASHRHTNPRRDFMHTMDRQAEQLAACGIARVPQPDLSWAMTDLERFALPERFLLLIPGSAAHRPEKRWPVQRFAELARLSAARGLAPVVLGGSAESPLGATIAAATPLGIDLAGRTSFGDLVALGARACHAVGNDTGPMHLVVAGGAPATVLFSNASEPALTAPRGSNVAILRRPDLAALAATDVAATLSFGLNRAQ
jgi:ADP-heptose:LPS heptosyltransferase